MCWSGPSLISSEWQQGGLGLCIPLPICESRKNKFQWPPDTRSHVHMCVPKHNLHISDTPSHLAIYWLQEHLPIHWVQEHLPISECCFLAMFVSSTSRTTFDQLVRHSLRIWIHLRWTPHRTVLKHTEFLGPPLEWCVALDHITTPQPVSHCYLMILIFRKCRNWCDNLAQCCCAALDKWSWLTDTDNSTSNGYCISTNNTTQYTLGMHRVGSGEQEGAFPRESGVNPKWYSFVDRHTT